MNQRKIRRLKRRLSELRGRLANLRSQELMRLARALGRERYSQRGKEPTCISTLLPQSRPISIPDHPGTLKKGTANNILDAFEQDLIALEEMMDDHGRSGDV